MVRISISVRNDSKDVHEKDGNLLLHRGTTTYSGPLVVVKGVMGTLSSFVDTLQTDRKSFVRTLVRTHKVPTVGDHMLILTSIVRKVLEVYSLGIELTIVCVTKSL